MIEVVIVIAVVICLFLIIGASRRIARQSRRIPCGVCGEPLLLAATIKIPE
jgi:hypothetical protein